MQTKIHPIYQNYEFNDNGEYKKVASKKWNKGKKSNGSYIQCCLKKEDGTYKSLTLSRAIWEAFNGEIPKGYEIDHIDNNKQNNKLSNLQCISMQDNRKRRDHSFLNEVRTKKYDERNIKCIDTENKEEKIFKSKVQCGKYLGVSAGFIYSKLYGTGALYKNKYKIEFTDEPVNFSYPDERIGKIRVPKEIQKQKHKEAVKRYRKKKQLIKNQNKALI